MTLELELLVNAWDNYKKNVIRARTSAEFTKAEEKMWFAVDELLDEDKQKQIERGLRNSLLSPFE